MNRILAVIDTNVVASGLISAHPEALVGRILEGMLTASFIYLLSPALLDEIERCYCDQSLKNIMA